MCDADVPEADPVAVGKTIALRHLEQAPRSRHQVEQRLRSRGVPPEAIDDVLTWLSDYGYLDDEAYAAMLVRSRTSAKRLARRALRHELRTHGVADDVAQQALATVSDEDELAMARAVVERRTQRLRNLEPDVRKRRLVGVLTRKGYSSSTIRTVVADLD